jgi:pimeloyl-ACP methyl ester carboxylesterase
MKNPRKYGKSPFKVAVIHGGPGAPGEMAPVARELASDCGILEPFQTVASINGQIKELKSILKKHAEPPVTLIGYSWGAWLSFIFTAKNSTIVKKLILISSGPFEEKYAKRIQEIRLCRLNKKQRTEVKSVMKKLNSPTSKDKNKALARFGTLLLKADNYRPIRDDSEIINCNAEIFQNVWDEASALRKSGRLLEFGKNINCPVIAIHGDYDPHPAEGVQKSLSDILRNFRFILLKNCGHTPWIERQTRDKLFRILKTEI